MSTAVMPQNAMYEFGDFIKVCIGRERFLSRFSRPPCFVFANARPVPTCSSRVASFKDLAKPASKRRLFEADTMFVFAIPEKREMPPTGFHIALPRSAFVISRK